MNNVPTVVKRLAACRVCTDGSGDEGMGKAGSTLRSVMTKRLFFYRGTERFSSVPMSRVTLYERTSHSVSLEMQHGTKHVTSPSTSSP